MAESEELSRALGRVVMSDDDRDPPSLSGPFTNPVDRFAHLPVGTRAWLEGLREDDIKELREAVQFSRSAKTIGKFGRWVIVTVVATFVGAVTLGEKVGQAWHWLMSR